MIDDIRSTATQIQGIRLLHINSTASGGVAELLNSLHIIMGDKNYLSLKREEFVLR